MEKLTSAYFNDLAKNIHENENAKWWYDENGKEIENPDYRLMTLVISEMIEAFEGYRRNLKDDKLTHRDQVEVELADVILRLLDRMMGKKLDLFSEDYKYFDMSSTFNFEQELHHNISMCFHPSYKENTQFMVYSILDMGYDMGYDVMSALNEKREYNAIRKDHTYAARKEANGKKF